MFGVDGKEINEDVAAFRALLAKVDGCIDQAEIRGFVVTLNQTAANLKAVSEKLLAVVDKLEQVFK